MPATAPNESRRRHTRRTAKQWRAIIQRFDAGGLNQSAFCKRENLVLETFRRWRRHFLAEGHQNGFIELRPAPSPQAPTQDGWTIEIDLPGVGTLRLRSGQ